MQRRIPPHIEHLARTPKNNNLESSCVARRELAKPILIIRYPIDDFEDLSDLLDDLFNKGVDGYIVMAFPSKKVDNIEFEVLNGN